MKHDKSLEIPLNELFGVVILLVIIGIGIAVGMDVVDSQADSVADCTTAGYVNANENITYNATSNFCRNETGTTLRPSNVEFLANQNASVGINEVPKRMKTIGLIVVASVLLTLITTFLVARLK